MKRSINSFIRSALTLLNFQFKGVSTIRKGAIQLLLVLMLLAWIIVPDAAAFGLATISITDSSVVEGDSGTTDMVFTLTRTGDVTSTVEVGYTTVDGTAMAGVDYTAQTGTVTIPAGEASATINVPVLGNTTPQVDRSFTVQLTGVVNTYGPPVSFSSQSTFGSGLYPMSMAAADLNGDGRLDITTANRDTDNISVLLNSTAPGAATPSFVAKQDFGVGDFPLSVAARDINGDGRPDLAVVNNISNTVSVLINTTEPGATTATFATRQDFATGSSPQSVAAEDFNGDGKADLAIANWTSNSISVLLNTTVLGETTPSFAAKQDFGTASSPVSVVAGDLNGDGKPDLASANYNAHNSSVLFNTTVTGSSTLSFTAKQDYGVGFYPTLVAMGDLNGDGRPDLAITNYNNNTVSVLVNTTSPGATTPSFAAKQDFDTGSSPQSVAIEDLNGDGRPDLAITNMFSNFSSVLVNTTVPGSALVSFAAKQDFTTGMYRVFLVSADFNGDGKYDLATANWGHASISVLLNTTALAEGPLAFTDQQSFGVGNGPSSLTTEDFNGDGKSDLAIANPLSDNVSVLLNTTAPGATAPSFSAKQDFDTGIEPNSVTAADFNGDGRPDLASANYDSNSVSVLLSTTIPGASTLTFAGNQEFGTGNGPYSVVAVDFNGDGRPDLVCANFNSDSISVLLNTTAPGATTPTFAVKQDFGVGSNPYSVAVGDFNGDGRPDLASANGYSDNISVLLNTTAPGASTPTFAAKRDINAGSFPYTIAARDFNGDGRPDLALVRYTLDLISLFLNTTSPGASTASFAAKQEISTGNGSSGMAVGDLNGDGKFDIVTSNWNYDNISILLNTTAPGGSTFSFAVHQDFTAGDGPTRLAVSDFNGDGGDDVAYSNINSDTISVRLNRVVVLNPNTATGAIIDDDGGRTYLPLIVR